MFGSKHYINLISITLIGITAFLFILKFSYIYTDFQTVLSVGFIGFYLIAILLLNKYSGSILPLAKDKSFIIVYSGLAIAAILYIYLVPRIGQINRLTAIQDWWDLFFEGIFPYKSKLTPSSFPALFVIALPFELIGNLGWLQVIGLALFMYLSYNLTASSRAFALFSSSFDETVSKESVMISSNSDE